MHGRILRGPARAWLLGALALLLATPAHARPAPAPTLATPAHARPAPAASPGQARTTFVNLVPGLDGSTLFVEAGDGQAIAGDTLFASVSIGPGGNKRSYTMTLSDTRRLYYTTVVGLTPGADEEGLLAISSTLGLATGPLSYRRAFLARSERGSFGAEDGGFELELIDPAPLRTDTYLAITPSLAPPGPPPPGHRIVGPVYSARVAEPQPPAAEPYFIVRMSYGRPELGGADPRSLGIFAWEAAPRRWRLLESLLLPSLGYLSAADQRFTTYALMALPGWGDEFDDSTGLGQAENALVRRGALTLADPAAPGEARSQPIALPAGAAGWRALSYTAASPGPLTVDVLAADGAPLLLDAAAGADLSALDPALHPAIVLRARLGPGSEAPALERWGVQWRIAATLQLDGLEQPFDGTPRPAIVTTDPPGLPIRTSYSGVEGTIYGPSPLPPTAPGTYRVDAAVDDPAVAGTASGRLVITGRPRLKVYLPLLRGAK